MAAWWLLQQKTAIVTNLRYQVLYNNYYCSKSTVLTYVKKMVLAKVLGGEVIQPSGKTEIHLKTPGEHKSMFSVDN